VSGDDHISQRIEAHGGFCQVSCQPVSPELERPIGGSCSLQDDQHHHTPPEKEESTAIGGYVLIVAGAEAEKVAEFIVCATEPSG